MKLVPCSNTRLVWVAVLIYSLSATTQASDLIGLALLRSAALGVDGSGIRVAQPEASLSLSAAIWAVNPAAVGQASSRFTYYSEAGSATVFPNTLSEESSHADGVGAYFYGIPGGVATNVAHVDNYDAEYFFNSIIAAVPPFEINSRVVNQSFIFGSVSTNIPTPTNYLSVSVQQQIDTNYDNYAVQYKTFFVSGAGNSGPVCPPATCYNGLGVAAYGGDSSTGPTLDNGRCKPDITAPASATSYSTPQVSGAAALLMQAGLRGDGGSGSVTNWAVDIRTLKALLLNGAVKPLGWTNSPAAPLDARYGAGMLNVLNSYQQLAGGKRGSIVSTTNAPGGAHPPTGAAGTVAVLSGWDYGTNTSGKSPSPYEAVNHYYLNVTNKWAGARFTATATLVWNRQASQTAINNLDLFLYDTANSNLVLCSTSRVDNVEHLYKTNLAQGRYDLQVWKAGGSGIVSAAEPYALAFEFFSDTLSLSRSGTNAVISWPVYPDGFLVESAANLAAPAWITNTLPAAVITNGSNRILLPATNGTQFFRLRRPDF